MGSGTGPINPDEVVFDLVTTGRDAIKKVDQQVSSATGDTITIAGTPGYTTNLFVGAPLTIKNEKYHVYKITSNTSNTITCAGCVFTLTGADYVTIGAAFDVNVAGQSAKAPSKYKPPFVMLLAYPPNTSGTLDALGDFENLAFRFGYVAVGRSLKEALSIRDTMVWMGKRYRAGFGQYDHVTISKSYPAFSGKQRVYEVAGLIMLYKYGIPTVARA